jgi:hypothetical protein
MSGFLLPSKPWEEQRKRTPFVPPVPRRMGKPRTGRNPSKGPKGKRESED